MSFSPFKSSSKPIEGLSAPENEFVKAQDAKKKVPEKELAEAQVSNSNMLTAPGSTIGLSSTSLVSMLGTSHATGMGMPSTVVTSEAEKLSIISRGATPTSVRRGSVILVPKVAQCSTSKSSQSGVGFVKTIAKATNYYSGSLITDRIGATVVAVLRERENFF